MGVKLYGALVAAAAISFAALVLFATRDESSSAGLTLSYSQDSNRALADERALLQAEDQETPTPAERRVTRPVATATPADTATVAPTPTPEPTEETPEPTSEATASGPIADATLPEDDGEEKKIKDNDEADDEPLVAATAAATATEEPEPEPEPTDNNWSGSEQQMLEKHNQARSGEGLSSLSPDSDLQAMAEYRCQQLGSNFSHDGFRPALSKFGISYSAAGENLATIASVSTAFNAWMGSPGHRANILENSFDRVGIAYCEVGGQSYWVVDFAG